MSRCIRLPGFPPPDKQDSVRFYVLKGLSYSSRMLLYLFCIILGFTLQLLTMTAWPGAVFLICATVLNLVVGYDSRVRLKSYDVDSGWTAVDMERIQDIERLDDRLTKWNRDSLDISNALGVGVFLLAVAGVAAAWIFLNTVTGYSAAGFIFLTNAVILVLPLWFNGIRHILKQDNLRVKTGLVRAMEQYFRTIAEEGEVFRPALMLARGKDGKAVPTDTRFTISFNDMPADFYGIQAQININIVQGSSYPYFYCVIAAKNGFGLEKYPPMIPARKKVTVEFQRDQNAEVIVIRHTTTKNTGYHTTPDICKSVLDTALAAARIIRGGHGRKERKGKG